jgi:hypothetical protein
MREWMYIFTLEVNGQLYAAAALLPEKRPPGTRWVGLRTSEDDKEK